MGERFSSMASKSSIERMVMSRELFKSSEWGSERSISQAEDFVNACYVTSKYISRWQNFK